MAFHKNCPPPPPTNTNDVVSHAVFIWIVALSWALHAVEWQWDCDVLDQLSLPIRHSEKCLIFSYITITWYKIQKEFDKIKKKLKNHKNKNPCLHACTGFQKQEFLFILADSDFTIIINIFFSVPQLLYHKINYFHLEVFFYEKKLMRFQHKRTLITIIKILSDKHPCLPTDARNIIHFGWVFFKQWIQVFLKSIYICFT